jgi:hypothetical protein
MRRGLERLVQNQSKGVDFSVTSRKVTDELNNHARV